MLTRKADEAGHPELFRQTNIDFTTMLENLSVLLADEDRSASRSSTAALILPTNEDVLKQLVQQEISNAQMMYFL